MISNSVDVDVDIIHPSISREASRPYRKLSCKCKQARCSHCNNCKQCACTCASALMDDLADKSKRSCRKLHLTPDTNILKSTTSHINSKPSKKRRGRPPTNKRKLLESTVLMSYPDDSLPCHPTAVTSPSTSSPPQKSIMTPSHSSVQRQSNINSPLEIHTSNNLTSSKEIGHRVRSLTRDTSSRLMYHNQTSIKLFQSPLDPKSKIIRSTPEVAQILATGVSDHDKVYLSDLKRVGKSALEAVDPEALYSTDEDNQQQESNIQSSLEKSLGTSLNTLGDAVSFFDGHGHREYFRKRVGPEDKRANDQLFSSNHTRCFNFLVKKTTAWIWKLMKVILPSNPSELFRVIISKQRYNIPSSTTCQPNVTTITANTTTCQILDEKGKKLKNLRDNFTKQRSIERRVMDLSIQHIFPAVLHCNYAVQRKEDIATLIREKELMPTHATKYTYQRVRDEYIQIVVDFILDDQHTQVMSWGTR